MGFNTRDKDEALRKAEYMLVSTGYNKGIVFNRYESIHIVLKDETIEIIQHIKHTDTENKGGKIREQKGSKAEAGLKTPRDPAPPKLCE